MGGFWINGTPEKWACKRCKYDVPIRSYPFACEWCTSSDVKWYQGHTYHCRRCAEAQHWPSVRVNTTSLVVSMYFSSTFSICVFFGRHYRHYTTLVVSEKLQNTLRVPHFELAMRLVYLCFITQGECVTFRQRNDLVNPCFVATLHGRQIVGREILDNTRHRNVFEFIHVLLCIICETAEEVLNDLIAEICM